MAQDNQSELRHGCSQTYPDLVIPVALYNLVLRGPDTIEDDITISLKEKEPLLRDFETILEKNSWTYDKNGPNEKDRELLVHFDDVITEYKLIESKYRDIIKDITHKMGNGMADYTIKGAKSSLMSINSKLQLSNRKLNNERVCEAVN